MIQVQVNYFWSIAKSINTTGDMRFLLPWEMIQVEVN
jgi:hypothetical protein